MTIGFLRKADLESGGSGAELRVPAIERPPILPPAIPASLWHAAERAAEKAAGIGPELPSQLAAFMLLEPRPATAGPPARPPREALGTVTFDLVSGIFEARAALEKELTATSKEYQVLKSLEDADVDVCRELRTELDRRLEGHPLVKAIVKLNEAYSIALRYRRASA